MADGLIDVAYVEVLPDLKRFDANAERDIKKALKGASKAADDAAADISDAFADAGKDISNSLKSASRDITVMADKAAKQSQAYFRETKAAAEDLIKDVERQAAAADPTVTVKVDLDTQLLERGLKRDVNGKIRDSKGQFATAGMLAGLDIGENLAGGVLGGATKGLAGLGGTLSTAISSAGPYVQGAAITLGVTLAGALAPAIAAIGLALPAAVGVGAVAIGTLTLGFQGLGDAIENAGDPEKFAEALEKLSPAAQRFAIELKNLMPVFTSLRLAAQEGIFKGLEGELTRVTNVLAGPLKSGLGEVGASISHFISEMADLAVTDESVATLNGLFATTAQIIRDMTPSAQIFFAGIGDLVRKALPFVSKLTDFIGILFEEMGQGLAEAAQNGTLDEIFSKGLEVLTKVWEIGKELWDVFKGFFAVFLEAGGPALDGMKVFASAFADLLSDKETLQALVVLFQGLGYVIQAQAYILKAAAFLINLIIDAITWLVREIIKLGKAFPEFAKGIGEAFSDAWNSVKKFFSDIGSAISNWASSVGQWFSDAWDSVKSTTVSTWNSILDFFKAIPGRIGAFFSALPGLILGALKTALSTALQAIGVAIGLILWTVLELPKRIPGYLAQLWEVVSTFFVNLWNSVYEWTVTKLTELLAWLQALPGRIVTAISTLLTDLGTFFTNLWNSVSEWTVNAWNTMIAWFIALPGRIVAAISALATMLGNFFTKLWADIKQGAVDGWNAVVAWIQSIPGKLSSLGGQFLNAGKNMIRSLFDGLASAGEFAGRVGSSVYNALKSGLNWAIRQINSGIDSVDSVLPGSLPRLPMLASGGIAAGPTIAGIGEAGDEMVMPLQGQRGRKAMQQIANAAQGEGTDPTGAAGNGVRVWGGQQQQAVEVDLTIDSSGNPIDEFLAQILAKYIRVRGGNVQKVLGKAQGGVA